MNRPGDIREYVGKGRVAIEPKQVTINNPEPPCKGWYYGIRLECPVGQATHATAIIRIGGKEIARYEGPNGTLLPISELSKSGHVLFSRAPGEPIAVEVKTNDYAGSTIHVALRLGGPVMPKR